MILCLSSLLKLSYISLKFSWENFVVYQHEDITIQQLPFSLLITCLQDIGSKF